MTVLVTGAKGFVGPNLITALRRQTDVGIIEYDVDSPAATLNDGLAAADGIFHLAGVNGRKSRKTTLTGIEASHKNSVII
jgi:UDP-2-acetamido-2,6-beta-L-arabino-hexul-4-ose reductase